MPTIDESVERAARAIFTQSNVNLGNAPNDFAWEDADQQCRDWNIELAKAALSAFLADVPVSDNITRGEASIAKAYCAKLAEEIQ